MSARSRAVRRRPGPGRPGPERGVSLVEVLLAVVVLSAGFLAAARLQVQSLATSQNAYALSQAKLMALEMGERLRANRAGVRAGLYDGLVTAAGTAPPACLADATGCSPAAIRDADRHAWSRRLHAVDADPGFVALLPSADGIDARGSVARVAGSDVRVVSVAWAERTAAGPERREVAVRVTP